MEDVLFELVQVSLGTLECLSRDPNEQEWKCLSALCQKQAISGVVFQALEGLSAYGQKPPLTVLYEWIGYVQTIETRNRVVNKRCVEISQEFANDGFKICVLKGQGNAVLYPKPLLRTPGDIDLWVKPEVRGRKFEVRDLINYVKRRNPEGRVLYHHVDMGYFKDVEVEVHFRPTFMFNLVHNYRIQRWFCKMADGGCLMAELPEGGGTIKVPDKEFNIIFQLSHVYNHLLHEGIGLRQIIDYYYLLKSNTNRTNDTNYFEILQYLGLEKIAGAMMWMLHEKLGLEEEYLIAPMDKKRGKYVLNEILRGGNFGYYDENNKKADSPFKKNIQRLKRDIRMMRYFPSECLWEPIFRVYHFFWRLRYN